MQEGGAHDCEVDARDGTMKDKKKRGVVEKFEEYDSESDPDCDDDTRIRKRIEKRM